MPEGREDTGKAAAVGVDLPLKSVEVSRGAALQHLSLPDRCCWRRPAWLPASARSPTQACSCCCTGSPRSTFLASWCAVLSSQVLRCQLGFAAVSTCNHLEASTRRDNNLPAEPEREGIAHQILQCDDRPSSAMLPTPKIRTHQARSACAASRPSVLM